jgi:hypothetical protein
MRTALLNGPSKTSKTTIGEGIRDYAQDELSLSVVCADAGEHYRKITVATRLRLGVLGLELPPEDELSEAVAMVLKDHEADDPDRHWGDLHAPGVNAWVSTAIANRPNVKADASGWYERTAQNALNKGTDLLIINGRQPRQVLAPWLGEVGLRPSMELWTDCHPIIAAERVLKARAKPFTRRQVQQEAALIRKRRLADARHAEFAMTPPRNPVQYVHYPSKLEVMASLAVEESWRPNGVDGHADTSEEDLPRMIRFDNSYLDKPSMIRAASLLTQAALIHAPA